MRHRPAFALQSTAKCLTALAVWIALSTQFTRARFFVVDWVDRCGLRDFQWIFMSSCPHPSLTGREGWTSMSVHFRWSLYDLHANVCARSLWRGAASFCRRASVRPPTFVCLTPYPSVCRALSVYDFWDSCARLCAIRLCVWVLPLSLLLTFPDDRARHVRSNSGDVDDMVSGSHPTLL